MTCSWFGWQISFTPVRSRFNFFVVGINYLSGYLLNKYLRFVTIIVKSILNIPDKVSSSNLRIKYYLQDSIIDITGVLVPVS